VALFGLVKTHPSPRITYGPRQNLSVLDWNSLNLGRQRTKVVNGPEWASLTVF
jgi:hypothetical protein